jgi:hypothetical protein
VSITLIVRNDKLGLEIDEVYLREIGLVKGGESRPIENRSSKRKIREKIGFC